MARSKKEHPFHFKPMAEMIGIKEVVKQLGLDAIIAAAGPAKVIEELLRNITPAERAHLIRRLDQAEARKK